MAQLLIITLLCLIPRVKLLPNCPTERQCPYGMIPCEKWELTSLQINMWKREYEADAVGYDVYLQIIERSQENTQGQFAGVFHDYLYTAPMILFQFYEDTYFWSYWLFGERIGNSHPPLYERFDALLRISEQSKYTFDTHEGNILLNNYMDISESFREQLILKLQKGKLHQVIQGDWFHVTGRIS